MIKVNVQLISVVKSITRNNNLAKTYLYREIKDSNPVFIFRTYFLVKKDDTIPTDIIIKKFKDNYLTISKYAIQLNTLDELANGLMIDGVYYNNIRNN